MSCIGNSAFDGEGADVLTLCYFEGLEYEEVAARLVETVESTRHQFYELPERYERRN